MEKEIEEKIKKLLEENNYIEILKKCNDLLQINEKDSKAYFYKGKTYYNLGEYKKSIESYNKAIEFTPEQFNVYNYNNRGLSKAGLKQYKEAIKDYNKAIEQEPNYSNAFNSRGVSKYYLKQYKEAIKDYNKAIKFNKESSIAYNNRGVSKYYLKQYKKSISDYNKAIMLDKNYSIAYSNRGKSKYYIAFNNEDKFEYYKKAIEDFGKVKNKNQQTYILKSVCHLLLKEKDKVIDTFRKYYKHFKSKKINFIIQIVMIAFDYPKKDNIDNIFDKLISNEYEELWKYDTIFNLLKRETNSEDILKDIKNILLYQYLLLKSLSFNNNEYNSNDIEISYYTSLNTLLLLLNDKKEYKNKEKENEDNEGKMRMVNISNANDPKEGKILESIFNKNGLNIKLKNDEKLTTLQTSFSRNKDSLTMFRLYGKAENKEATGVCLVINKEYFNTTPLLVSPNIEISNQENISLENLKKEEKKDLYWVLYYNEKENILAFNPDNFKYKNKVIDLNKSEKEIKLDNIENIIEYIFYNIFKYTKKLNTKLNKEIKDKTLKDKIFSNLFENIKYIIKNEAFFEEQELRMLITTNYEDRRIEIDNDNKRLYINYIKLFDENINYIDEIILGPRIENAEGIAEYINKILINKNKAAIKKIHITISKAPLR